MNCNITPESKLQTAAFRPRLWVTFIVIYSLPMSFYYFFSLQDFVSTTYAVFSFAFLTSLEASYSPFSAAWVKWHSLTTLELNHRCQQPNHLPPWLLGAGAYSRTWEGCRRNMGLASSGMFITLYGQKSFLVKKYKDSFVLVLFSRLLQLATFIDK